MIKEGEVFEFEARNLQPKFARRKIGDVYALNVELTEDQWEQIKLIPPGATLVGRLYWTMGDDPQIAEKADKQIKGEYGKFWEAMCKKGLLNNLDLRQVLGQDDGSPQDTKRALYDAFNVCSLSEIHPAEFARWAAERRLVNLVVMAEQAANVGVN